MPASSPAPTPAIPWHAIVVIALFLAALAIYVLYPGTLLDPLPLWLSGAAALVGLLAGLNLAAAIRATKLGIGRLRKTLGLIAIPLFAAITAVYYLHLIVELLAFAGARPHQQVLAAPIQSFDARKSKPSVVVRPGPDARLLHVPVSDQLYRSLDRQKSPGRDCILLTVQTGRQGIRRTTVPASGDRPFGVEKLVRCPVG